MSDTKFTYLVTLKKGDEIVEETSMQGPSNISHLREREVIMGDNFNNLSQKLISNLRKKQW